MTRVVTLLPSATEIVAALGFEGALIGRSHECDHPPGVERLPVLTRAKLSIDCGSDEIDRQVRGILEQALSVYAVDAETLRDLAPDLVVTQAQCEVCAVSLGDVQAALADWSDARPHLVSLQAETLDGIFRDIEAVATALGDADGGRALVARLRTRMATLADATATRAETPRVACIEWLDPLMVAGTWVPELVGLAGGLDCLGKAGLHAETLTLNAIEEADPDHIVLMPCGFDMARTRAELPALSGQPGWARLRAVRDGRVAVTDGNQYFNRPGPRVLEALEILLEILQPEQFDFGHRGRGWAPLGA